MRPTGHEYPARSASRGTVGRGCCDTVDVEEHSDGRWSTPLPAPIRDRLAGLDDRQAYIVLVVDPDTKEADAHGPYTGLDALCVADTFRRDLDAAGLGDVLVDVTRLHLPTRGAHRSC